MIQRLLRSWARTLLCRLQLLTLNSYQLIDVPAEFIAKEKEILTQQAMNDPKNATKPANIIEKMIAGRLKKELKEICLVEQPYVKGWRYDS